MLTKEANATAYAKGPRGDPGGRPSVFMRRRASPVLATAPPFDTGNRDEQQIQNRTRSERRRIPFGVPRERPGTRPRREAGRKAPRGFLGVCTPCPTHQGGSIRRDPERPNLGVTSGRWPNAWQPRGIADRYARRAPPHARVHPEFSVAMARPRTRRGRGRVFPGSPCARHARGGTRNFSKPLRMRGKTDLRARGGAGPPEGGGLDAVQSPRTKSRVTPHIRSGKGVRYSGGALAAGSAKRGIKMSWVPFGSPWKFGNFQNASKHR